MTAIDAGFRLGACGELAAVSEQEVRERVERIKQITAIDPGLVIVGDAFSNPLPPLECRNDTAQFVGRLSCTARRTGISVTLDPGTDLAAVEQKITAYNDDSSVHGIVPAYPFVSIPATASRAERAAATSRVYGLVAPRKNVDGLGAGALWPHATSQASVEAAGAINPYFADGTIAIRGLGNVGGGIARVLKEAGISYTVVSIDMSNAERAEILGAADTIFTATGAPYGLGSEHFAGDDFRKLIIDAGKGPYTMPNGETMPVPDTSLPLKHRLLSEGGAYVDSSAIGKLASPIILKHLVTMAEQTTSRAA